MSAITKISFVFSVVVLAACGAPNAVAQDATLAPNPALVPSDGFETPHFKTVCSIALEDLDGGVSIYIDEGWSVVNCSPFVNQRPDDPAPIIGHCCYLTR